MKLKEFIYNHFHYYRISNFMVFRIHPGIPGKRAFFMIWYQKGKRLSILIWKLGKISFERY